MTGERRAEAGGRRPNRGARLAVGVGTSLLATLFATLCGCQGDGHGGALLPPLAIEAVNPPILLPNTRVAISGRGFVVPDVADLLVVFQGQIGDARVEFAVPPERVDDGLLEVPVTGPVEQALIRDSGRFEGRVTVMRTPRIAAPPDQTSRSVDLGLARTLTPRLTLASPSGADEVFPMEVIALQGDDLLLGREGTTLVALRGVMHTDSPPRAIFIDGLEVPAEPSDATRRAASFVLTPDLLGVVPGRFEGELVPVNAHADGTTVRGAPWPLTLRLAAPRIDRVTPETASRGRWIRVTGRGFMAPDGLLQAAMVLQLEGRFVAASGEVTEWLGADALTLVPDAFVGNTSMSFVIRPEADEAGVFRGLGATPGRFSGTMTPLVFLGPDRARGTPFPFGLEIARPRQMVHLRALPGFDEALIEFGLLAEKEAVKARILEVCQRDYAGLAISFSWEAPSDYAEYGVVEIAGRDPNGSGLFGLDNTAGKDVGNLRFDDVVGGFNADTQLGGYAAYGGVFPGEFMQLSVRSGAHPLASPRFDDIFGPVSPALGGRPAEPGEGIGAGARAWEIAEAVRVLGNLVGSTISHEVGHTLGLAAYDGQFHNPGDNPGWIMDSGTYRSFAERAEIDGEGPSFFEPLSRSYLESILPL
jgi:hypothetical protein